MQSEQREKVNIPIYDVIPHVDEVIADSCRCPLGTGLILAFGRRGGKWQAAISRDIKEAPLLTPPVGGVD
jgi:hypothetical protein